MLPFPVGSGEEFSSDSGGSTGSTWAVPFPLWFLLVHRCCGEDPLDRLCLGPCIRLPDPRGFWLITTNGHEISSRKFRSLLVVSDTQVSETRLCYHKRIKRGVTSKILWEKKKDLCFACFTYFVLCDFLPGQLTSFWNRTKKKKTQLPPGNERPSSQQ